jgi:hypothetical protein
MYNRAVLRPEHDRHGRVMVLYQASGCESRHGRQAGAPCSRLRATGESPASERSVESPEWVVGPAGGERSYGPSASESLQPREIGAERRRGRARHVGAKATDCVCWTGATQDSSGVRETARSDSLVRNRRDPTRQPTSGEGGPYKPTAKGDRAERESEGLVVPGKAAKAAGGKGPCFRRAGDWG